jgi:hypothetical protein
MFWSVVITLIQLKYREIYPPNTGPDSWHVLCSNDTRPALVLSYWACFKDAHGWGLGPQDYSDPEHMILDTWHSTSPRSPSHSHHNSADPLHSYEAIASSCLGVYDLVLCSSFFWRSIFGFWLCTIN